MLFGFRFWTVAVLTGLGAGLTGGLLMKLLRFVQHHAWSYPHGNLLNAVKGASALHRIFVLALVGAIAATALWVIRRCPGEGSGLSGAIWFHSGKLPTLKTLADGLLSITIVGMGAPLGRESAPKEAGAACGSRLTEWAKLTRAERRLLAPWCAGAGLAAVYNLQIGGAQFGLEVLLGTAAPAPE